MLKRVKLRSLLILGCVTFFFLVLVFRVFWIQVVNGEEWQTQVQTMIQKDQVIKASRGTITDRNNDVLATDAPAYTVVVNPKIIQEYELEDEVVARLHTLLNKPESEIEQHVRSKKEDGEYREYREVRQEGWKIEPALARKIDEFNEELKQKHKVLNAVFTVKETKRFYPQNNLAAHVLGYVNKEGNAVTGLEAYYDNELKGTDGKLLYERDRKGVSLPNSDQVYEPAVNGKKLRLTIDDKIQYYIEEAMEEAFAKYNPISMTVIAADPKTMEILGMANLPTYNPNTYGQTKEQKNFINHALQSIYEPGSTFKIVTLAGAVEEKMFNPNAHFVSQRTVIGGFRISDNGRYYGDMSYLAGVKRSSNIAFVNLGFRMLGREKLRHYIDEFGFGSKTGIDLPAEVPSPIKELVYDSEVAAAAYGHGLVQVTPIQQVAAISAIANGGKLMEPHVVKDIIDTETGATQTIQPKVVRQVISEKSAKDVSGYLEQVVADRDIGTGRYAYIDGYRVAGKTGTARKVVNGKYDENKDVVSFIGFAPVDDPKIAVLVVIDEPRVANVGGGTAAAPIFKQIVSQSLQYMGVPKAGSKDEGEKKTSKAFKPFNAPQLTGKTRKDAQNMLLQQGVAYETVGKGSTVVRQYPSPSALMTPGQRIYLLTEDSGDMEIPDLTGVSLRDSLELLTLMKISAKIDGEGYVIRQKEEKQGDKRVLSLLLQPAKETVTGVVPDLPEDTNEETDGKTQEEDADTPGDSTEESGGELESETSGTTSAP